MRKLLLGFIVVLLVASSCKVTKNAQKIKNIVTKKDTTETVYVNEVPKVDSAALLKDIMTKVMKKKIDFASFNGKVKINYDGVDNDVIVTGYVSIRKDSLIYLKLVHSLYGLVFQVRIDKDSIYMINMKEKSITKRSIAYIEQLIQIPLDFSTLQDAVVGNPIFLDSNIVSYKSSSKELLVLMVGNVFKNLLTLNNEDFKIIHSKLDDVDMMQNRTCDIIFGNYQNINSKDFSMYREISISQKNKVNIKLDFKDVSFNEPLKYVFDVPKNFKQK